MESEVEKASSPNLNNVPSSWLQYFPGEEFRHEDRRAFLIRGLLDFFQTSASKQLLSQVCSVTSFLGISFLVHNKFLIMVVMMNKSSNLIIIFVKV